MGALEPVYELGHPSRYWAAASETHGDGGWHAGSGGCGARNFVRAEIAPELAATGSAADSLRRASGAVLEALFLCANQYASLGNASAPTAAGAAGGGSPQGRGGDGGGVLRVQASRGVYVAPGGRISATDNPTDPPNAEGEAVLGAVDGSAAVIFRGAGLPSPGEQGTVVVAAAGPSASLLLGSTTAAVPAACAPQVQANLDDLATRIAAWVPVPNDDGASLKAVFAAWQLALQDMADAKARLDGPV